MSTSSAHDQERHDAAISDEHYITARAVMFEHARNCYFCKKPGFRNRGICHENLLLNQTAYDVHQRRRKARSL